MNRLDLYKCNICGNIVQTIVNSYGELHCCGQPMTKLDAKTNDEGLTEKHVPIFFKDENDNVKVRVGEILHPMTDEHYIMFIETMDKDKNTMHLKYLYPNDKPEVELNNINSDVALEYCNIHGLWEGKYNA